MSRVPEKQWTSLDGAGCPQQQAALRSGSPQGGPPRTGVDLLDVAANRGGQQARHALDRRVVVCGGGGGVRLGIRIGKRAAARRSLGAGLGHPPLSPHSLHAPGRSSSAMDTSVAMASSAVGGQPTTCRPQGSSRDSISMSLPAAGGGGVRRGAGERAVGEQGGYWQCSRGSARLGSAARAKLRQQPAPLTVDAAHDGVALVDAQRLDLLVGIGQRDVLVQVALRCRGGERGEGRGE